MSKLIVAAIQGQLVGDVAACLTAFSEQVKAAKAQGAQLVVSQELMNTPYMAQAQDPSLFALAEPLDGPTVTHCQQLARQHEVVLVVSLFEKRSSAVFHNTAVVIESDGTIAGVYRKHHIPDDPGFYEKYYFTPGHEGFEPIQTSVGRLGILVCWDQWFPEAARVMALKGADVLIYPTAIGSCPGETDTTRLIDKEAWQTMMRSHAIANHLPVIAVNRVGIEALPANALVPEPVEKKQAQVMGSQSGIDFWGSSFVAGPRGEWLAQGTENQPEVLTATINFEETATQRRIWPYFRDRRIEHYGPLLTHWAQENVR